MDIIKEKCDCGIDAVYWYMPSYEDKSNPYYCETCVHRGCSCNYHHSNPNDYSPPLEEGEIPNGIEGVDWKWIIKEETEDCRAITIEDGYFVYLNKNGQEYPCCEYMYSVEGFDIE